MNPLRDREDPLTLSTKPDIKAFKEYYNIFFDPRQGNQSSQQFSQSIIEIHIYKLLPKANPFFSYFILWLNISSWQWKRLYINFSRHWATQHQRRDRINAQNDWTWQTTQTSNENKNRYYEMNDEFGYYEKIGLIYLIEIGTYEKNVARVVE